MGKLLVPLDGVLSNLCVHLKAKVAQPCQVKGELSKPFTSVPKPFALHSPRSVYRGYSQRACHGVPLQEGGWGLMGAPLSPVDFFENGNVPCRYFLNFPVGFNIVQCHLSVFRNGDVPCRCFWKCPCWFQNCLISPVEFKKRPCHPVEFKCKGPSKGER